MRVGRTAVGAVGVSGVRQVVAPRMGAAKRLVGIVRGADRAEDKLPKRSMRFLV